MKKNINIIITVVIAIVLIMLPLSRVKAESFKVSNSSLTLDIEKSATITINASTHTGRINISSSDANIATVNTGSLWVENNSQTITISAKSAGNATINISGLLYDTAIEAEQEYSQTINVTVNKAQEVIPDPEPEPQPEPEPTPEPEPEKPIVLEFTSVANKTMYLETSTNFRSEYRINSSNIITKLSAGTEVVQTGISKTQSEGYTWSKIIYNGQTGYVINGNLTDKKPEEQKPQEEIPTEEPKEEKPVEEPITHNENEIKNGLKSLEIEGLTLTPSFSSDIYEYRVIVKEDISQLTINAVSAAEGATITIAGNENIQEGENLITIVVYNAKNEVEATYQITTNKSTLDLADTDKMLQIGNKEAKRNATIFVVLLIAEIIVLIVIMILKRRNEYVKEDYEEEQDSQEFTSNLKNVENTEQQTFQEETNIPRREKRKGKHF